MDQEPTFKATVNKPLAVCLAKIKILEFLIISQTPQNTAQKDQAIYHLPFAADNAFLKPES